MNYELIYLNDFIRMHLSSGFTESTLTGEAICALEQVLLDEEERIKITIREVVFSGKPDPLIESFIRNHQSALVMMANDIRASLPPHQLSKLYQLSVRPSIYNLYKQTYYTICRLLDFIEKYFCRYFNLDHQIPDGYCSLFNQEIRRDRQWIYAGLKRHKIDKPLQGIIRKFLDAVDESSSREFTYRGMLYIKSCITELRRVLETDCKTNCRKKLCLALLYLNFNNPVFIYYCQRYIIDELNTFNDALSRYKAMDNFLDYFTSFQVKPDAWYNPNWPSVKVILKGWLSEKLEEMKERPNFKLSMPSVRNKKAQTSKITGSFSVAQLGCYLQVQEQEGIYIKNKKKDLVRITAQTYTSIEMENISEKSLSNACYNTDQGNAAVVMDACFRMGNRLKKNFFPE